MSEEEFSVLALLPLRHRYRRDDRILERQDEQWTTTPYGGSLVFDFKNPDLGLGLRSTRIPEQRQVPETAVLRKVRLGNSLVPEGSQKREVTLHDLALGGAHYFPATGKTGERANRWICSFESAWTTLFDVEEQ